MEDATDSPSPLDAIRDRVVALAGDVEGSRVLDVGCGDGLIGRALLPRVGDAGSVVFADQDANVLELLAEELRGKPNVEFRQADARQLDGVPDDSVQRVILRAVLLYIPEKQEALRAAWRVLQSGGRLVISEPVNRVLYEPEGHLWGYDLRDIPQIVVKVRGGFLEHEHHHVRAMTDWDDQDLFTLVRSAGFRDVSMETITESVPPRPLPWLAFMHAKWTPWMPTVAQVAQSVLDACERSAFEAALRPLVEQGRQLPRVCNTFIVGAK